MGIMAVGTEQVSPFSASKVSCPLPMDTSPPIPVLGPMTFATEPITLGEVNQLPVVKPNFISISYIMAIEAPPHGLGMMKLDL